MKLTSLPVVLCVLLSAGCFTRLEEIRSKLPSDWTSRECLTVMLANMRHNLDEPGATVQAIVTPYFPSVVEAITRLEQFRTRQDSEAIRAWQNSLLKSGIGLYVDWEQNNRLVNGRGNYYRDPEELDSVLFLVTLRNTSWPCTVPVQNVMISNGGKPYYVSRPIAGFADWPCDIPDITDLDRRIYLVNGTGDSLRAKFVWGRRNNQLTLEENVFVMFDFNGPAGRDFFRTGPNVSFVITGFQVPIRFGFSFAGITAN